MMLFLKILSFNNHEFSKTLMALPWPKNVYGPLMSKDIYGPPMGKNIYGPTMAKNTSMYFHISQDFSEFLSIFTQPCQMFMIEFHACI